MTIIITLILLIIIPAIIVAKTDRIPEGLEIALQVGNLFAAIFLFVALIMLPANLVDVNSQIEGFKEQATLVDGLRMEDGTIEGSALQVEVLQTNKRITQLQYCNESVWGLWVPNRIMDVEQIELTPDNWTNESVQPEE